MEAGQMDCRVTFQRQIYTGDESEYGVQPTGEWESVPGLVRIPAQKVDDLPSRNESVQGGMRMANRPARLRLRYVRGITSDMRVLVHNEPDEVFQISGGPAQIGRREKIELTLTEYST